MRQVLFEHFQLLLCRRIVFSIRVGLAMFSTALMSTPISPMPRKVGRSISASPAPLPLTKSNTSVTKQDCQLLPISPRLSVSSPAILMSPSSTRACLQLGGLCTRTDQNQTRNTVLFCSAAGTLGIPKSVVELSLIHISEPT